jgi:hypothetical protein
MGNCASDQGLFNAFKVSNLGMVIDGFLNLVIADDFCLIISVVSFFDDCDDYAFLLVANHYLCCLVTRLDLAVQIFLIFLRIGSCKDINLTLIVKLEFLERISVLAQLPDFLLSCDYINLAFVEANKSRHDI